MSTPYRLSNRAARRVFLDRHGLSDTPAGEASGQPLADVIHDLGFVQLDSINTVARAHDLILFARRPRYRTKDLERLYSRDKALFEHWTHDAAVMPMAFYPWWHLRRQRDAELLRKRWRDWRRDGFEQQFQNVVDHIRLNGPCCSSDVGQGEKRGSGGWWDWHPSKTALEYLWRSGRLAVIGRKGFQKYYDLSERVIDETLRDTQPDVGTTIDWCCSEALKRLGFATHGELAAFWDHVSPAECKAWADEAARHGRISPVCIECVDGSERIAWSFPDIVKDPALEKVPTKRLRVLSPFDPALRDRKRAERLFGFSYRIEIFVPEPKRKYGYYVFPLMEGDRLVGRIDMKAFRNEDVLRVRALWPEPGLRWGKLRVQALEAELERLKRLAEVSHVTFEPNWLRDT